MMKFKRLAVIGLLSLGFVVGCSEEEDKEAVIVGGTLTVEAIQLESLTEEPPQPEPQPAPLTVDCAQQESRLFCQAVMKMEKLEREVHLCTMAGTSSFSVSGGLHYSDSTTVKIDRKIDDNSCHRDSLEVLVRALEAHYPEWPGGDLF